MSLVHEALRKAEREKLLKTGVAPSATSAPHQPAPPPPAQTHTPVVHAPAVATPFGSPIRGAHPLSQSPTPERPRETNRYLLPALIGCVAIVAIIAIVFLVSNAPSMFRQTKEIAPASAASAAPVAVAPATPPSVAQPSADSATPPNAAPVVMADDSKYKISGIMKDPDGKPVAVINGRVAYEGYYVDGAIVEKIETDRVTLDVKGQKELLRLH